MGFFKDLFKGVSKVVDPLGLSPGRKALEKKLFGGKGDSGTNTPITDAYGADAISKFDQMYPIYRQSYNQAGGAQGLGGRSFERWLSDHMEAQPNDATNLSALRTLENYSTTGQMLYPEGGDGMEPVYEDDPEGTGEVPIEQGLYDMSQERILADIERDEERRTMANALSNDLRSAYGNAQATVRTAMGPSLDAEQYFSANPDLAKAYSQSGGMWGNEQLSAQQWAERHYNTYGKNEPRQGVAFTSQLQREYGNADRTADSIVGNAQQSATSQLGAIQEYASSMRQNLSGELQQRATALEAMVADLNANLDSYDANQRAAIEAQIAELGDSLETSIDEQRANLSTELQGLQGAVDAEGVARKAALAEEIGKLNAAQAPVADARMTAANNAATAVNLGLERTRDQLTSQEAAQGYVGGSSAGAANLARAAIGARQNAAGIMGQARLANATDTRDVATREATEGRSIADAIAAGTRGVTERGATGNRSLSDALATGQQDIRDYGSTSRYGLTSKVNEGRLGIGNARAETSYADSLYGAAEGRKIGDTTAGGVLDVNTNLATQTQGARDNAAIAKSGYFDNDYTRRLGLAMTVPSMTSGLTDALTGLDNYANSGLGRSLNTLNWWSTGGTPTSPGYVPVEPSQSGNNLAQLGAGIFSAGGSLATAGVGRWNQPKTTTTSPTVGASTRPTLYDAGRNVNGRNYSGLA